MGANQFILRLGTINSEQKPLRENVDQKNKGQAQLAPQVVTQLCPNKLPWTTECLPALGSMPLLISYFSLSSESFIVVSYWAVLSESQFPLLGS